MIRKLAGLAVLLVAASGLVAGSAPAASAQARAACVPAVAHRGGTERWTENGRNAFRHAANHGVLLWETDVRFTADDVPVLMHDETVDRTTDSAGPIAHHTTAELAGVRLDDGEPVPTLDELVNDAAVDDARILAELKTRPSAAQWEQVYAALDRHNGRGRVVLTSFDPTTLTAAEDIETGLVQAPGYVPARAVAPYGGIYVKHHTSITAARMGEWAGPLRVYAWTADTRAVWERMARYPNLAGVITNRPAAYRQWQRARGC